MPALLEQIGQPKSDQERIADEVLRRPTLLPGIVAGLEADTARVKYGCAKILRLVSERQPDRLYSYFDFFVRLLDSDNTIFQWEAIFVLAQLVRVDSEDKFTPVFAKYFAPISGPVMITAGNVIGGAATIALAKPHLADRIAREVLKVKRARYQTAECRKIACGHAIKSFDRFFDLIRDQKPILQFVEKQLKNSRAATKKKAVQFLKKHGGG